MRSDVGGFKTLSTALLALLVLTTAIPGGAASQTSFQAFGTGYRCICTAGHCFMLRNPWIIPRHAA